MTSKPVTASNHRLDGWKNITLYLGCTEKTARSWLENQGLPIYRESSLGHARVFAIAEELDAWRASRVVPVNGDNPWPNSGSEPGENVAPAKAAGYAATLIALVTVTVAVSVTAFVVRTRGNPQPQGAFPLGRIFARSTSEGGQYRRFPVPIDFGLMQASTDGRRVFVYLPGHPAVHEVNGETGQFRTIDIGSPVACLRSSPDGGTLYVGTSFGVRVLDVGHGTHEDIPADGLVSDLEISPDGRFAFLAMGPRGVQRVDFASRSVSTLTFNKEPYFLKLDPFGRTLFISYQGGGPGGGVGHDTVEAINLQTGSSVVSNPAVPLVGGPISFSPKTRQLWVDFWDACAGGPYDGKGCPSTPSFGRHVYRASDLQLIRSLTWPKREVRTLRFSPDGIKAVFSGRVARVLDAANFQTLEVLPGESLDVAFANAGRTFFIFRPGFVDRHETLEASCVATPVQPLESFAFDGAWDDAIYGTKFSAKGPVTFVPGVVGAATRIPPGGRISMISPAAHPFGDALSDSASVAFWFRSRGPSRLMERNSGIPWSLKWSQNLLTFSAYPNVMLTATADREVWHHVAITKNENRYELFLDGRRTGSAQSSGTYKSISIGPEFFSEGDLDIDEFHTFFDALTPEAVRRMASLGSTCYQKPT